MKFPQKLLLLLQGNKHRHPWPARLLHWTYAPAVLLAAWSGSFITRPSRSRVFRSMDSARQAHFIAQYVLLFSYLARVYYGYVTKTYEEIIPSRETMKKTPGFFKYLFFFSKKKPKFPKYNPGQKLAYTGFALLIPLQMITGFTLYAPREWQKTVSLAGGLNQLRRVHYLAGLGVFTLAAGHIYMALTEDLGKLKSIFTGYK